MKLYVGNLSWDTNEAALSDAFAEFGEVVSVNIIKDRETGRSRGFGFVEMAEKAAGEAAVEKMDGTMVDGRSLKVNEARPRTDRGGGGRGRGGGRRDFGGGGRRDFGGGNQQDRGGYQGRRDNDRDRGW